MTSSIVDDWEVVARDGRGIRCSRLDVAKRIRIFYVGLQSLELKEVLSQRRGGGAELSLALRVFDEK